MTVPAPRGGLRPGRGAALEPVCLGSRGSACPAGKETRALPVINVRPNGPAAHAGLEVAIPTPTRRDTSAPRLCSRLRPPARPWGQLLIALTRHVPRFKVATPSATFRSPPPRKRPAVCKPAVLFTVEFGARHPSRLALALDQRAAQPSPTAVDGGHAAPCACPHGRRRRTEAGVAGSGEALQGRDQEGCPPRRGLWPHGSAGPWRDGRWARSPGPGRPGQLLFLLEG